MYRLQKNLLEIHVNAMDKRRKALSSFNAHILVPILIIQTLISYSLSFLDIHIYY